MGQASTKFAAVGAAATFCTLGSTNLNFVSTAPSTRSRPTATENVMGVQDPSSFSSDSLTSTASSSFMLATLGGAIAAAAATRSRAAGRGHGKAITTMQAAAAGPDFSQELGVSPPLGFWDPLGLSKFDDPVLAETTFRRRRIVEIQHGRVSMLACIGFIVPEYFKFPGYLSPSKDLKFEDIPNGFAAISKVPGAGWTQIIGFIGIIEVTNLQTKPSEYAGDYGYGAFGLPYGGKIGDKEKKEKSLLAEINNGRLAMMAIIGMFFQNGLTGTAWGDWSLYTDSPLRAAPAAGPDFSQELGVSPPLGFWDPLGLSKFDNPVLAETTFRRRRIVEIQHGRVSMLACIGFIVPEYFKFPGYLSPSKDLKFEDIPNGFAAISKVPGAGWTQIIGFIGIKTK
jgi:hypothetical protein